MVCCFVTGDGLELTYRVVGGPAEPLVCLPGGPLRATSYLRELGGLDAHRQLVLFELPARRVDQIVDDVEMLREHLGCARIDILAHSAGANLGLLYAAAHPDRVGKLALITPGARAAGIRPERSGVAALRRAMLHRGARGLYGRWDAEARAHAAAEAAEARPRAARIYYAPGAFDLGDTRRALAEFTGEVLIVIGERDRDTTVRTGEQLAALFPHARLVVQRGAAHFPWLDGPHEFVATLAGFLNGPSRPI